MDRLFSLITRASLRLRWVTILVTVALLAVGVWAVTQLNQELMPSMEFPFHVVVVQWPGSDAETMVDQVAVPMEQALMEIDDVLSVDTTASPGFTFIMARSEFGVDMDATQDAIERQLAGLSLPPDVEEPQIITFDFNALPILIASASADMPLEELRALVEERVVPELEALEGVAAVAVYGGQEIPPEILAQKQEKLALLRGESLPSGTATPSPTPEPTTAAQVGPLPTPVSPSEIVPAPLPDTWEGIVPPEYDSLGIILDSTADLTGMALEMLIDTEPELLNDLTEEMLLGMGPAVLAALPEEFMAGLDPEVAAELTARIEAMPEPPSLPLLMTGASQVLGVSLRTAADLNALAVNEVADTAFGSFVGQLPAEVYAWLIGYAPGFLDDLDAATVLPMLPAETLALFPRDYLAGLEPELAASLMQKLGGGEIPAGEAAEGVPLPDVWLEQFAQFGLPLKTTADLTPEIVAQMGTMAGAEFFAPLTPEMLNALPPEVLEELPAAYATTLDPAFLAQLDDETRPVIEALAGELAAAEGELPTSWQAFFATSPTPVVLPSDLDAAGLAYVAYERPELMAELDPDHLLALTPDALRALPADYLDTLDESLVAQLAARAQAGGTQLGALPAPPPAPEGWVAAFEQFGMTLQTAAGFGPQSINAMAEGMPGLVNELTPEVLDWHMALRPDFLDQLEAGPRETVESILQGAWVPRTSINRTNGAVSLGLSVAKTQDANTVRASHAVMDRLDAFAEELGIRFDYAFEQASFIEESISGVAREGALGALFAVFIILLFLSGMAHGRFRLGWRSTLVTAVSIPTSVMIGFALMRLFGLTLNIMTLSGMTVAVGRVVDDSIVVLENIYRHIQRGEDRWRAAVDGTREVSIAIFASTVTTVAVFLPVGLIGGIIGQVFLPFGLTVTFALAASFFVAITIVPLLAYLFIRQEHLPAEGETWMQKLYTPVLRWAIRPTPWVQTPVVRWFLNNRFTVLAIATVLFVASLGLMGRLPQTFIPDIGEPQINVQVSVEENDLVLTDLRVQELEAQIQGLEGIEVMQTLVGSSGGFESVMGGGHGVNGGAAEITISATSSQRLGPLTEQIRAEAESLFTPDEVTVSSGGLMQQGMGGFEMILVSDDFSSLVAVHDPVLAELQKVEGLTNVASNLALGSEGEMQQITRVNGQRALSFSADVESQDTLGVQAHALERVEALDLPAGVRVEQGFATEQQTQGFADMFGAMGISVLVVYLAMVLTFGALLPPFDILFSLPFAVVGAALALVIRNQTLGISSMIGLVMLVGIVVTNAIVLIDLVQSLRRRGKDTHTALMEAGRTRLRPIWMTALAAVLALIPLALGLNEGAIIAAELATAVIGGLLVSTFLTLVVVPVVYSLTDSAVARLGHMLPGRLGKLLVRISMGWGAANGRPEA
jgi:HAE1 family hydrophobic/amphiphilic exporter-1